MTEIDYDLSKTFQEGIVDAQDKLGMEPSGGLKRPSTAPGKGLKSRDFVSKFKDQMKPSKVSGNNSPEKERSLKDIPEAVEKEKLAKYEEEIEILKEERDDLKNRLGQFETEKKNMDAQLTLFRCENTELKMQLGELRMVHQENRELRKKIDIINESKDK